ncbi:MAG: hypothetical protein J6I64_08990 [Lachnospiraceae bacterium]|nr:hypothetical protein [Lachnospiraceae bacterium]
MKIITVCGSYRFQKEMKEITERLALQGNCMITPIELTQPSKDAYSEKERALLAKMHRKKIDLADAILVVNVGGYIGTSTKIEIEYAESQQKEILYYTDWIL